MSGRWMILVVVACGCGWPGIAWGVIDSNTNYTLDLTQSKEAGAKATWSDAKYYTHTAKGLGWGTAKDSKSSRNFWLQTEPVAIGLSWRPTSIASISVSVDHTGAAGLLYARYSADGKNWTTWQYLEGSPPGPRDGAKSSFRGTLRVPYRESAAYDQLRLEYARRNDVAWGNDEEGLVKSIVAREPKYFEKSTPFIGYVQFLYETSLHGGDSIKGVQANLEWSVSGLTTLGKTRQPRHNHTTPWRFKAQ